MNDSQDKNRCDKCGGSTSTQASASITQWIQRCSCRNLEVAEAQEAVKLCEICGKRVSEGRSGSFTQWVFRADLCKCDPALKTKSATVEPSSPPQTSDDEVLRTAAIEVDPDKFPVERYIAISVAGGGAAGTVYLCHDKLLQKRVAIKTLNTLTKEQIIAFQKEARATSSLDHDNIIKVLDFGITTGGTPYMVMEHFGGDSLDKILLNSDGLDVATAIEIFLPVCRALGHAHKKGIFHRDVKCSNILIAETGTSDQQVNLIDFGVAGFKQDEYSTIIQGVTLVGTPQYMSPDQAQSRPYDARSEIYSLGCSLFETLTGSPPFSGETALDLINQHAKEKAPALAHMAPEKEFPDTLEDIVSRCLEKRPENRFQAMEELENALTRLATSLDPAPETGFENTLTTRLAQTVTLGKRPNSSSLVFLIPLAVAGIILVGGLLWALVGSLTSSNEMPVVSNSIHNRELPVLVNIGSGDVTDFKLQTIGDRHWLIPESQVKDTDLLALKDRRDFEVLGLDQQGLTGKGLRYLVDCNLQGLSLHGTTLTNEGYNCLAQLESLHELIMDKTDISDQNIEKLKRLKNLRLIALDDTPVSDEGVQTLSTMKSLQTVSLAGAKNVTGKGLRSLAALPNLKVLVIDDTSITSQDLPVLKTFPNLHSLCVRRLKLTDKDIDLLTSLKLTAKLDIARNAFTDRSLKSLSKLEKLERLQVAETMFSPQGIAQLRHRLPNCVVQTSL